MAKSSLPNTKIPKNPNRNPLKAILIVVIAVLVMLLIVAVMAYVTIFASSGHGETRLTVKAGDTYHSLLADKLWQDKPLASRLITRLYLKQYATKPLQKGSYTIKAGASLAEVVKILGDGAKNAMITVQIIEGKTVKDLYHTLKTTDGVTLKVLSPKKDSYTWADVKTDNDKVAAALGIQTANGNLEGWFSPDTYYFNAGTSDEAILKRLYNAQAEILDKAWQNRAKDLPYKSPYEALIMASIIEKETGIKSERPDVAAVFVNRLKDGMKLQTDPTIIYGLFDRYDGKIYKSNIAEKTAYNTYQIDGLPPTPIALPSKEAIESALHPSTVPYRYFVATGKGGHKFSVTLDEHNKAVDEYRRVMAGQ